MELRKVSDDGTKITLEHDPVAGAIGFRLSPVVKAGVVQAGKFAHTWDGSRTQHKFASGFAPYTVEALVAGDSGVFTGQEPPPPPPPTDPTAFGYRPELPAGWTLVENKTLTQADYNGKQKIMFRNCRGGAWFSDSATADLTFVDCDLRGGCGTWGKRISFYGCRMGERVDADAVQVKPLTSGGPRPEGWLFQGCTIRDITRAPGSTKHTDGIQFGGILGAVVRHCYFDNIAVEMILCNGWNGKPEDVLIEQSFFGTRTSPGGPPIHFSTPSATSSWPSTNCRAVDNYYDGTVASVEQGTVGCTQGGTKPRADWPHHLRADGWLDY